MIQHHHEWIIEYIQTVRVPIPTALSISLPHRRRRQTVHIIAVRSVQWPLESRQVGKLAKECTLIES